MFEIEQTVGEALRLGWSAYWKLFGVESARDLEVARARVALLVDLPLGAASSSSNPSSSFDRSGGR